jgi:hypothetical protein
MLQNEVEKHLESRKEIIAAMDAERREKSNVAKQMRLQEAEMLKAERKALYDQRYEMQLQVRKSMVFTDSTNSLLSCCLDSVIARKRTTPRRLISPRSTARKDEKTVS